MQYREDVITMIVAEEEWCADQLVKMASRIGRYIYVHTFTCAHTRTPTHLLTHSLSPPRNTLKPELERAAKEMHEMFDQVRILVGNCPPPN